MPNYVDNDLAVEGNESMLLVFQSVARSGLLPIDFNKAFHCPEELRDEELHTYGGDKAKAEERNRKRAEMKAKHGFCNANDFCTEVWGTKWNAMEGVFGGVQKDAGFSVAIYKFKTAWCPPLPVVIKFSKMFPTLTFHLYCVEECGNFDPIHFKVQQGKVVERENITPDFIP